MKNSILFIVAVMFFPSAASAQEQVPVRDRMPLSELPYSTPVAMGLDILPGGGHFYTGHYLSGSAFAAAKIGGFAASWCIWQNWQSAGRDYRSAKRTRDSLGVSDDTPVRGGRSVASYRRDYDRQAQFFTFSLAGNAVVWAVSWFMVWQYCDDYNRRAIPAFDIGFDTNETKVGADASVRLSLTMPF